MKLNNLSITATIPTSGYAPGQAIKLQLDVVNKSCHNISEFKVELNKVSTIRLKWIFYLHYLSNMSKIFNLQLSIFQETFQLNWFIDLSILRFLCTQIKRKSIQKNINYNWPLYLLMDAWQTRANHKCQKSLCHRCRQPMLFPVKYYISHTN